MFTGLVEGIGQISGLDRRAEGLRLAITPPFPAGALNLGESVSVSGACLTVVALKGAAFQVDVSPETLARTTLGQKKVGDRVNLERALRMGDRLGGHLVTGHVDGLGMVKERREGPEHLRLALELPPDLLPLAVEKGSIAVEGVSLTINEIHRTGCTVNVIPYTARHTTLGTLKVGDPVNLEMDLIGKYVHRLLGPYLKKDSGLTEELLARLGFLK
jgi:riboflavin synthase|uniref:Riboflavin synthase n=1 Tax=Desulfobacca acetoxidans TaxID=60893 RepID=A0A7C5AN57_9BACT